MPNAASDLMRRLERVNAFCEAIRALDATGLLLLFNIVVLLIHQEYLCQIPWSSFVACTNVIGYRLG